MLRREVRAGAKIGRLVIALLVATVVAACGSEGGAKQDQRSDLVLITIDTLRADHVGPWREWLAGPGGPWPVETPAIDAFAANSLIFEDAFSAVPLGVRQQGGHRPFHVFADAEGDAA